jgi:hypothetical protein
VRILNRFVSALLALALLAGGLVLAAEIVSAAFGRDEPLVLPWDRWYDDATTTPWSDPDVRLVCAALVVAGVLLLLLEAARRRPTAIPMSAGTTGGRADLDRRGLEAWLGQRMVEVDGVSGAKARITKSAATVRAETPGRETGRLRDELQVAAGRALDQLELARPIPVKVTVQSTGRAE